MKKFKIISVFCLLFVCCFSVLLTGCIKQQPKIEIVSQFKTSYYVGEELDVLGGIIKYTDENKQETLVEVTKDMVSSFATHITGTRNMILTYNNCTLMVEYVVSEHQDVKLNTLYTSVAETQFGYIYATFSSNTTVHCTSFSEKNPYMTAAELITEIPSAIILTKSVENNVISYSGEKEEYTIKITVQNSDMLHLVVKSKENVALVLEADIVKTTPQTATDVVIGEIYRSEPQDDSDDCYQYVVFTSESTVYITSSTYAKLSLNQIVSNESFTATRGVKDGKICYSLSFEVDGVTVEVDIYVTAENKIYVYATNGTLTMSFDLILLEHDIMPYIEVFNTFKTNYAQYEELSLTGGKLLFHDTTIDGIMFSESIDILPEMISDFSTEESGNYQMTISYKGCTLKVNYTVIADIDINDFYVNNLGVFGEGTYEYIKFDSKTEMRFWGTNVTPDNMAPTYYGNEIYQVIRTIEDGKVVYQIVISGEHNVKIIVESSDHIIITGVEDGQTETLSLYKYESLSN